MGGLHERKVLSSVIAMALTIHECSMCDFLSPLLTFQVSHFRLVQSKDCNFSVSCGIGGCVEHFRSFSAYTSHVYRRHRTAIGLKDLTIGEFAGSELPPTTSQEIPGSSTTMNIENTLRLFYDRPPF